MSKISMYRDLVKCKVLDIVDTENTKVYENDIVISDENVNVSKEYKVETDNMTDEEIIMALLAKQNLMLNTIKNILCFFVFLIIFSVFMFFIAQF